MKTRRWLALLLAGILLMPQASVYAAEMSEVWDGLYEQDALAVAELEDTVPAEEYISDLFLSEEQT